VYEKNGSILAMATLVRRDAASLSGPGRSRTAHAAPKWPLLEWIRFFSSRQLFPLGSRLMGYLVKTMRPVKGHFGPRWNRQSLDHPSHFAWLKAQTRDRPRSGPRLRPRITGAMITAGVRQLTRRSDTTRDQTK